MLAGVANLDLGIEAPAHLPGGTFQGDGVSPHAAEVKQVADLQGRGLEGALDRVAGAKDLTGVESSRHPQPAHRLGRDVVQRRIPRAQPRAAIGQPLVAYRACGIGATLGSDWCGRCD